VGAGRVGIGDEGVVRYWLCAGIVVCAVCVKTTVFGPEAAWL